MGRHSPAVAELDRIEDDYLRARARELVAELDDIADDLARGDTDIWRWAGKASVILKRLARD